MVITVTLNPAIDKTLKVQNFSIGEVNRSNSIRYDIGGKGVNVSKVLKNFNIESSCIGFIGGLWENIFLQELSKRGIAAKFTHISGEMRTNTKIVDELKGTYTDLNEEGPKISEEVLNMFLKEFAEGLGKDDIVILSGGVSPSVPKNIYNTMTSIAKEKGAYVILDASGELLEEGIKAGPDIIKPNEGELRCAMHLKDESHEAIILAAKGLLKQGISKVLISLGKDGAYLVTSSGVSYGSAIEVPVKSTVGAGDSMVAALVYGRINNLNDKETLNFANACGAASVGLEGSEACTLEQVKEMLKYTKTIKKEAF